MLRPGKPLLALLALSLVGVAAPASAKLKLPAPSPLARVMQTVGIAEITVEYSSPGVKERQIFGGLVPFDKLWRTGANAATKITFSHDVMVAGKAVPAGTYAVFTIPSAKDWTLILNKNAQQGGTRKYDKKLDQVRVKLTPTKLPEKRERMTFVFSDTKSDATRIDLEWDTLRLSIPVTIPTQKYALAAIDAHTAGAMRELASAARYHADHTKDLDKALAFIDMSIAVKRDWFNVWLKADFLAQKGEHKKAYPLAEEAWKLGNKAEYFFWKDRVKKALDEWKAKI